MNVHEKFSYVEYHVRDLKVTKDFFSAAFGWIFQDYGPDYTSFTDQGLDGGFRKSNLKSSSSDGAALLVFYSNDLEATEKKVTGSGGTIVQPIFSFPGGRRFHFTEPSGNEFAVWTDKGA